MNWRAKCHAQREKTTEQRFWEKVRKTDSCWEWIACKDKGGYGFFRHKGKNLKAHRFVLELTGKHFSTKAQICHSCDNPSCVNPKHLWIGDNRSNQIDSSLKGRQGSQKLSAFDVREIRRRRAAGETGAALAREFSLSGSAYVRNIVVGRKWAHVDQS